MANHRRSAEKEAVWRGHLAAQGASGQSIRRYCREQKLSEPSFYVWRRELANRDRECGQQTPASSGSKLTHAAGLVAVDVIDSDVGAAAERQMELCLANGVVLRLRESVSAVTLERVMAVAFQLGQPRGSDSSGSDRRGRSC